MQVESCREVLGEVEDDPDISHVFGDKRNLGAVLIGIEVIANF